MVKPIVTEYGQCYKITPPGLGTSSRTGATHGLRLLLNAENYDAVGAPNSQAGIKVTGVDNMLYCGGVNHISAISKTENIYCILTHYILRH